MKKISLYIFAVAILSLGFACGSKTETTENKPQQSKITGSSTSVLVPVNEAAINIQKYIDDCKLLFKDSVPVMAFTTRAADLLGALGLPDTLESDCQYSHVRAYLGLDSQNKFKLYFVSVSGATLASNIGGMDVPVEDPAANSQPSVLDLNTPCPQVCASNNIFSITATPKGNDK